MLSPRHMNYPMVSFLWSGQAGVTYTMCYIADSLVVLFTLSIILLSVFVRLPCQPLFWECQFRISILKSVRKQPLVSHLMQSFLLCPAYSHAIYLFFMAVSYAEVLYLSGRKPGAPMTVFCVTPTKQSEVISYTNMYLIYTYSLIAQSWPELFGVFLSSYSRQQFE